MTDREAVALFKRNMKYWGDEPIAENVVAADRIAIYALQERIDRSEGCEFCRNKDYDSLWEPGGAHDFRLYQDGIFYYDKVFGWEGMTIRFCPMCGRKLKTAMTGEER